MPAALRILFGWLLLAALLVAAASYSQGTRYALVAEPGPAPSVVQHAAALHSPAPQHHACCDRYPAPRSEPAPTKAAAPDPPRAAAPAALQHVLQVAQEPEPRRQALTLDQLSISRT
ncbi:MULTISPECIES: hypothetical protein [unclassified Arthrobacter]|uniref:hypothetical protein n=1 Tax=unclassified Arthrobacter TaxID=235627 RepID=UPI001F3648BB|nr:hypothetical protein [Arthrobacter sp. FW306-06-A]UKA70342.1 hypothetical protein LFT49_16605 [Arthrobacter sp. FW306-06-A]